VMKGTLSLRTAKVLLAVWVALAPAATAQSQSRSSPNPGAAAYFVHFTTSPRDEAERLLFEKYKGACFVADRETTAWEQADKSSKSVWTLKPLELALIVGIRTGWFYVASGEKRGWIAGSLINLIPRTASDTASAIGSLEATWPIQTKMNILRREPQIGFSKAQVELALGEPLRTVDEQTATATTTVMLYQDRSITLIQGKVTKIVTLK
jgi:hypothetical protein